MNSIYKLACDHFSFSVFVETAVKHRCIKWKAGSLPGKIVTGTGARNVNLNGIICHFCTAVIMYIFNLNV